MRVQLGVRGMLVAWAIGATATSGCHGNIGGPSGAAAGAGGPGAPAFEPGADPGADVRAEDEAMRMLDPELFEVAERYFPGDATLGSAPRLSRLTRGQLDTTVRTLFPASSAAPLAQVMPRDPLQTNYEYAENLGFQQSNFTPFVDWVHGVALQAGADTAGHVACATTDAACLDAAARRFVTRAFRGVLLEGQLDRYAQFFTTSTAAGTLSAAWVDLVDLALTSPSFVFREEVLTEATGVLLPAQRLQHLAYTLADVPPEALGLGEAGAAAADFDAALDTALRAPAARDKLMRFFMAWLEVREADELAISTEVFPELTPALAQAIVDQTRAFLTRQLQADAPALHAITAATDSIVGPGMEAVYGAPGAEGERFGVFTQPAVIASHSGPTTTRLVKRGVFFTRKVMCMPLGVPPEDVDTTVPTTPGATERQRIEGVTASARCQGCHAFINPFGFMQENYDAIGRYRTLDEGLPVNASIHIDFLDEAPFSADSPVEALMHLTSSLRFQQCFARQLFRFYMGRNEQPGDDPVLRSMFFQFALDGRQDIVQMLRVLSGSVPFSQRAVAP